METKFPWKITIIAIIIVCILWILGGGFAEVKACGEKRVESVTALFSGLAFAGMMIAIYLQSKELSLQRRELELTREELHRTAEANEKAASLANESLLQQQEISKINNEFIRKQILTQIITALLENIYKNVEYSSGTPSEQRKEFHTTYAQNIKNLIGELEKMNILGTPVRTRNK